MYNLTGYLRPARLIGPILHKELRVTARRKRSYVIRFLFLFLMMAVIALPWIEMARWPGNVGIAYRIAQMSQMAMTLTVILSWLLFLSAQMLAIVFLSGAISDEIYHKTLGVLMTTPITGVQIVFGKLLSRMLSLLVLLALSLPVLGLIRLLGGVPWDYVLGSFCITLTAAIFAGTISLFISIFQKRAFSVIIQTIFVLFFLYLIVPVLIGWLSQWTFFMDPLYSRKFLAFLSYFNPFIAFSLNQSVITSVGLSAPFVWPWHSMIILAASVLILLVAAKIVRRIALMQIAGQGEQSVLSGLRKVKTQKNPPVSADSKIRTVRGQPVVWKETRDPWLSGRKKRNAMIAAAVAVSILLVSYVIGIKEHYLHEDYSQVIYGMSLFMVGIIEMIMLSATMITTEREAGSWPILLTTPLSNGQILFGKAAGVVRKSLPVWCLLIFHLLLFTLVGYIHPAVALHLAVIIAGVGVFALGSGLFFSGLCKRTTSAVTANVLLAAGLWLFVPMFAGLTGEGDLVELIFSFHPIAHAGIVLAGGCGSENASMALGSLQYSWPQESWEGFLITTIVIGLTSLAYAGAGLFFYMLAKNDLREHVFE